MVHTLNRELCDLEDFLVSYDIDLSKYWEWSAKDVSDLLEEINSWETELVYDSEVDRVIRKLRVLAINVFHKWDLLSEEKQVFKDTDWNETDRMRIRDHIQESVWEKISQNVNLLKIE